MDGALVVRWGPTYPGREAKGLEVLAAAQATFDDLAKSGRVRGHREYISVTGNSGGCMIVEGDIAELSQLLYDREQLALDVKAAAVVSDFSIELMMGGTEQGIQDAVGIYLGGLQDVGYL